MTRRVLVLVTVALLVLGACSDDSKSLDTVGREVSGAEAMGGGDLRADGAASDPQAGASGSTGAVADGGGRGAGDVVAAVPVGTALTAGRSLISTANARVAVDDVEEAARRAIGLAIESGGFLAGQESRLDEDEIRLTLRVPSEGFHDVLTRVSELGELIKADVSTQDVTEQVVDLETRIGSARVSIERIREFLDQSGDITQLVSVESELARREAELESLLGRLRVLEDQVELSTIDVEFFEEAPEPEPDPEPDDDLPGFLDALGSGWGAFTTTGTVVLAGVGYTLPFAAFLLVVAAALVTTRRGIAVRRTE